MPSYNILSAIARNVQRKMRLHPRLKPRREAPTAHQSDPNVLRRPPPEYADSHRLPELASSYRPLPTRQAPSGLIAGPGPSQFHPRFDITVWIAGVRRFGRASRHRHPVVPITDLRRLSCPARCPPVRPRTSASAYRDRLRRFDRLAPRFLCADAGSLAGRGGGGEALTSGSALLSVSGVARV